MKRFLSFIFCISSIVSKGQQQEQSFKLDSFNKIPSGIGNCSGLFTYDSTSLKKKEYIIATDLDQLAFIKINGKLISLKLTNNNELTENKHKATYKGNGYTIILTTITGKQIGVESSLDSGSMEILNETYKLKVKVHGVSQCK